MWKCFREECTVFLATSAPVVGPLRNSFAHTHRCPQVRVLFVDCMTSRKDICLHADPFSSWLPYLPIQLHFSHVVDTWITKYLGSELIDVATGHRAYRKPGWIPRLSFQYTHKLLAFKHTHPSHQNPYILHPVESRPCSFFGDFVFSNVLNPDGTHSAQAF